jgi:hypothetical protein
VLNENDDLDWLPAETGAAMRDLARTVTDAPPLRLTADATGLAPARPRRRPGGPRFRWTWGTPLLAAAAVVAAAVTLVIVKDLPTGQLTPATIATSSATAPGTAAASGTAAAGLPEYYVALNPASGGGPPDGLIVGDTRAGKTIAIVTPPADTSFVSVTGAADDRTFVVSAAPASGGSGLDERFYLLTITPGSAPAAKLTQLPMEPLSGVIATALSASGQELAVATASARVTGAPDTRELAVYSVATGRPLRSWSTTDTSAIVSDLVPGVQPGRSTAQYPALTWIDGDQALAFPVLGKVWQPPAGWVEALSARSIAVTATGTDLMADSKVLVNLGDDAHVNDLCGTYFPVVSGNGTTLFCAFADGPDGHTTPTTVRWVLQWQPWETSLANRAEWRFFAEDEEVGVPAASAVTLATVWSSSDGATLLVEWSVARPHNSLPLISFGELTKGKNSWTFTLLPTPTDFAAGGGPPAIAW